MSPRTARLTPLALFTLVAAAILALVLTANAGAAVAQSSDAGGTYATTIAKAKEKRAAKLKKCNSKAKAKRVACKKAANKAYQTAKETAQEKRDAASNPDSGGGPPDSRADEYQECVAKGGDPTECKEAAKGGKGVK
jgi:Skp family chaperone for outer membrane proteins